MQKFFQANKVLLFGLFGAIAMSVQQVTDTGPVDYKVLGLAALVAGIGFLAKDLRGQWPTILGSLIPSLAVLLSQAQAHQPLTWHQLAYAISAALAGLFAPPAKSLAYEQTPEITAVKAEAAQADATAQPPKTPPVSK